MKRIIELRIVGEIEICPQPGVKVIVSKLSRPLNGGDKEVEQHRANSALCQYHWGCSNVAIAGCFSFSCINCPEFPGKQFRTSDQLNLPPLND